MVTNPGPAATAPRRRGVLDLDLVADRTRCPVCGAALAAPRCARCGADLTTAAAGAVWDLSQRILGLVDDRAAAVETLARVSRTAPVPAAAVPPPAAPDVPATAVPAPSAPAPSAVAPSGPAPSGPAPSGPAPSAQPAAGPAAPPAQPPPFPPVVPAGPPPAPAPRLGVQGLLVGLGALLLAVAAIVFLAFAWGAMGIGGRSAVVAGITLAALASAAAVRPRLEATGEAIGALAAVLVLADVWAVRRTGLLGADEVGVLAYSGSGLAVAALVLGGWALRWRVRAGSVVASGVLPVAAFLECLAAGPDSPTPLAVGLGLLAAATVSAVRGAVPAGWDVERVVLRLAATGALLALPFAALGAEAEHRLAGGALLAGGAVVAGLQAVAERHRGSRPAVVLPPAWSVVAGGLLATSGVLLAARAVAGPAERHTFWLLAAPAPAAALAVLVVAAAAPLLERVGVRGRPAALAGTVVTGLALLADAVVASVAVLGPAAAAAARPWSATALQRVGSLGSSLGGGPDGPAWDRAVPGAALGFAAVAVLLLAARRLRPAACGAEAAAAAPFALGAAAMTALCLPPFAVVTTAAGLAALALLAAVAGARIAVAPDGAPVAAGGRAAVLATHGVAVVAGLLAVVDAWSVPALSVPFTLLGVVALVLARPALPAAGAFLTAPATVATAVAAGGAAGLAGLPVADRVTTAGLAGALLAALAAAAAVLAPDGDVPAPHRWQSAPTLAERLAAVLAGVVVALAALGHAMVTGAAPGRLALLLAGLLVTAAVAAAAPVPAVVPAVAAAVAAPGPAVAPAGPGAPAPADDDRAPLLASGVRLTAAGALPALVAATAVATFERFAGPVADPVATRAVVTAAAVAGCAVLLALTTALRPAAGADPRRPAVESGLVVAAGAAFLVLGADPVGRRAWVTLMLLGVAAAAVATAADRRPAGWAAWGLLTASSWVRLSLGDVRTVEAYTLPPAAALLVVAGLRVRRERSAAMWRALAPGAGLALVPSVLASAGGGDLRRWLLLGTGAALVAAGAVPAGTTARGRLVHRVGAVLAAAGALAALGTALLRTTGVSLGAAGGGVFDRSRPVVPAASGVEAWSLPAAVVVLAAAVVLAARHPGVARRARGLLLLPGLVVLTVPSWLAAAVATSAGTGRLRLSDAAGPAVAGRLGAVVAVLVVAAAACAVAGSRPDATGPGQHLLTWHAAVGALVGVGVSTWTAHRVLDVPVETFTVTTGALAVALGALRLRQLPDRRSVPLLAPGLLLALAPTLVLATGGALWRVVGLAVVAGAVVAVGASRRLLAPVAVGAAVLGAHAVVQVAPYVADLVTSSWRWVAFAVVGGALLALGATYERQLVRLRTARTRLAALR